MLKIYPLGHKASFKLLSSHGKHTSSKEAAVIVCTLKQQSTSLRGAEQRSNLRSANARDRHEFCRTLAMTNALPSNSRDNGIDKIDSILKPGLHLAFAASKKNFPRAVDRNRIKRRFRGALTEVLQNIKIECTTILMLIIPKQKVVDAKFDDLRKLISNSLETIKC